MAGKYLLAVNLGRRKHDSRAEWVLKWFSTKLSQSKCAGNTGRLTDTFSWNRQLVVRHECRTLEILEGRRIVFKLLSVTGQ